MNKKLKTLSILALFVITYNTASANIFQDTVSKITFTIKGLFSDEQKINNDDSYNTSDEEPVLKAKYNTDIVVGNIETKLQKQNLQNDVENVLRAEVGPMRTSTDEELIDSDNIQVYEVKEGDTLSSVAKIYGVSKNTIAWANEIKNGKAKVGDILIILPISGVKHTIKKGDTLKSISKKYAADILEVSDFNGLKDGDELVVGEDIIIPDGKLDFDAPIVNSKKPDTKKKRKIYASAGIGYFVRPIVGGIKTQGLHGHNGVDIGAPVGTPLLAAANGTVLVAKNTGYNGGYGKMVIISHPNGTQTVYGHMSNVYVSTGQSVTQGEQIGESGNSGKSTGPHLHFEVRGAENPF